MVDIPSSFILNITISDLNGITLTSTKREILIAKIIVNLFIGGFVYAAVALFGGPTWADLGFAITTYLVVANGTH